MDETFVILESDELKFSIGYSFLNEFIETGILYKADYSEAEEIYMNAETDDFTYSVWDGDVFLDVKTKGAKEIYEQLMKLVEKYEHGDYSMKKDKE